MCADLFDYDAVGALIRERTFDADDTLIYEQEYEFNTAGDLTLISDADNNTIRLTPDGLHRNTLREVRDSGNNLVSSEATQYFLDGKSIVTDGANNTSETLRDAAGRAYSETVRNASNVTVTVTSHGFDTGGFHTTTTVGTGDTRSVSAFTRDGAGNATSQTVSDGLGNVATVQNSQHTTSGETNQTSGFYGFTDVTHDADGRVLSERTYNSAFTPDLLREATYKYTEAGHLQESFDGNGNKTAYLTDALGRTIDQKVYEGTTTLIRWFRWEYDTDGNLKKEIFADDSYIQREYNGRGDVRTETVYDASENPIRTTTYTYTMNGQLETIDQGGLVTKYEYDPAGRKKTETVGYGTAMAATTSYFYDDAGKLERIEDAVGNETTFGYTGHLQTSITDALGNTTYITYNDAGRMESRTDRNGRVREFDYDGAGHLIEERWLDGANVIETLTYTFDDDGNLLTASSSGGDSSLEYNAAGQVTSSEGPDGATLTFTFDLAGNRTLVEDSFGGTVESAYDAGGGLLWRTYVAAGEPELRIEQTINLSGLVTNQKRYSDAAGTTQIGESDYTYEADATSRIATLEHFDSEDESIAYYEYVYNDAGQITEQTDHGQTKTFSHDGQGQLTGDGTNTYQFDLAGNRDTSMGYTTGDGNRLESDGTWDYTHDDEGNLIGKNIGTDEVWVYTYDYRNRLIEVDKTIDSTLAMHAEYEYDAIGNRTKKSVDEDGDGDFDLIQKFAYDGSNPAKPTPVGFENYGLWAELDDSGSLTTRHFPGDAVDQVFARLDYDGTGVSPFWNLGDHLQSIQEITDAEGVVVDEIRYDSFGNIVSETTPEVGGHLKYTSRYRDKETGWQLNGYRFYISAIGRWNREDPSGFAAGDSNLYRYVHNLPTVYTDGSGLVVVAPLAPLAPLVPIALEKAAEAIFFFGTAFAGALGLGYAANNFEAPIIIGNVDDGRTIPGFVSPGPQPGRFGNGMIADPWRPAERFFLDRFPFPFRPNYTPASHTGGDIPRPHELFSLHTGQPIRQLSIDDAILRSTRFPTTPGGTGSAYDRVNGQGIYVLREPNGGIRYVGSGDAPSEIARYTRPGGHHEGLVGEIVFNNNLPADQAISLERELQHLLGGPISINPGTSLRNRIQALAENNPNFLTLEFAANDRLVIEALRRLGLVRR